MIAYLKGKILSKIGSSLILDVNGVGYKVAAPSGLLLSVKIGQEVELYIHSYIREDQFSLYGFPTAAELQLFEFLISVSGVGPKLALSILSATSPDHVKSAIASGDTAMFTKVSGVGRKTAERLIVELREKIGDGTFGEINLKTSKELAESLDALVALGYSQNEAREALRKVPKEVVDSGQIIRAALRTLGGR